MNGALMTMTTMTLCGTQVIWSLGLFSSFGFIQFTHFVSGKPLIYSLANHLLLAGGRGGLTWLHTLRERSQAFKLICESRAVSIMTTDESCRTADDNDDEQSVEAKNRGAIGFILRFLSSWRRWRRE